MCVRRELDIETCEVPPVRELADRHGVTPLDRRSERVGGRGIDVGEPPLEPRDLGVRRRPIDDRTDLLGRDVETQRLLEGHVCIGVATSRPDEREHEERSDVRPG